MPTYTRDRFTWLGYLMLAYYAYLQAALGPLMPFLRKELDLNYTVAALHFSAFALGMILAGVSSDEAAQWFGRKRLFWLGGAGMAACTLFFIGGVVPAMTILGVFGMGFIGTYLLVMIQSTLADHHGDFKAVALTEANVIASIGATLAPLLVGGFQQTDLGWRVGLLVPLLYLGILASQFYRLPMPAKQITPLSTDGGGVGGGGTKVPLPPLFWNYWLVIFLGVSIEWSIIFWGAEFLEKNTGLERATAATIMSVYFGAVVLSRAVGSQLTRRFPTGILLLTALILTAIGFFLFWLSPMTVLAVVGLFIAGLGVANLFPLTLSVASNVVTPAQSDAASGRISLGAGMAILIAPQILGTFADATDIKTAYGVVVVILGLALLVTLRANQQAAKR